MGSPAFQCHLAPHRRRRNVAGQHFLRGLATNTERTRFYLRIEAPHASSGIVLAEISIIPLDLVDRRLVAFGAPPSCKKAKKRIAGDIGDGRRFLLLCVSAGSTRRRAPPLAGPDSGDEGGDLKPAHDMASKASDG